MVVTKIVESSSYIKGKNMFTISTPIKDAASIQKSFFRPYTMFCFAKFRLFFTIPYFAKVIKNTPIFDISLGAATRLLFKSVLYLRGYGMCKDIQRILKTLFSKSNGYFIFYRIEKKIFLIDKVRSFTLITMHCWQKSKMKQY